MLHFARWKIFSILGAVLVAIILALPNVLPKSAQDQLRPYNLAAGDARPRPAGRHQHPARDRPRRSQGEADRPDRRRHPRRRCAMPRSATTASIASTMASGCAITKPEDVEKASAELKKLAAAAGCRLVRRGVPRHRSSISRCRTSSSPSPSRSRASMPRSPPLSASR